MNIPLVVLENELIKAVPLEEKDFEPLFQLAADPLIWEQHPNPLRYQKPAFTTYFTGAIKSEGAYVIYDTLSNQLAGCSRFYDYNAAQKSILIGYTFLSRAYWGLGFNKMLKKLMLMHAFQFVDTVFFHIGIHNIRSQKAMEKLGATQLGTQTIAYYGEPPQTNIEYCFRKNDFEKLFFD